jgi:hypothetical protein
MIVFHRTAARATDFVGAATLRGHLLRQKELALRAGAIRSGLHRARGQKWGTGGTQALGDRAAHPLYSDRTPTGCELEPILWQFRRDSRVPDPLTSCLSLRGRAPRESRVARRRERLADDFCDALAQGGLAAKDGRPRIGAEGNRCFGCPSGPGWACPALGRCRGGGTPGSNLRRALASPGGGGCSQPALWQTAFEPGEPARVIPL